MGILLAGRKVAHVEIIECRRNPGGPRYWRVTCGKGAKAYFVAFALQDAIDYAERQIRAQLRGNAPVPEEVA